VEIPLVDLVPDAVAYTEVSYIASADTEVVLRWGPREYRVPLRQGLHNVFFQAAGPARAVIAEPADPSVSVCIDRVNIGARFGPDSLRPVSPPPVWSR
jgi:hypothetical protein